MSTQDSNSNVSKFSLILEDWSRKHAGGSRSFDPVPILNNMAELLEQETEEFYKMDPDPLDDRSPGRQIASCGLGQMMRIVFRNDEFMNTIITSYLLHDAYRQRQVSPLFTATCRVLLVLLPGMETSVPFRETEGIVQRLYYWAEFADDPVKSYATGLLGGAMEFNDVAVKFREESLHMVPLVLDRLHQLVADEKKSREEENTHKIKEDDQEGGGGKSPRYFAAIGKEASTSKHSDLDSKAVESSSSADKTNLRGNLKRALSPSHSSFHSFNKRSRSNSEASFDLEHSNSSWAELRPLVIGTFRLEPLTVSMKQRLILQYLHPLGDYHELLSAFLDHDAMGLIFHFINFHENKDIRLAFEALKFLSVVLCHKKFAAEFIAKGGIQRLLEIHRPSIAATGVSLCFYYITYFEDATERVCSLPESVLSDLVSYNLWLLECSHDSSRCHACLFFSQTFSYHQMLNLFDQQNGLRRLVNAICTLSILNPDDRRQHTDDELHQMRQSARLVCEALCKYFYAHTLRKTDELCTLNYHDSSSYNHNKEVFNYNSLKTSKMTLEELMEIMLDYLPSKSHWAPEVNFVKLGGVKKLCQLMALAAEWDTYPGKTETVVAALNILTICSVSHRTLLLLLEDISMPENMSTPIMSVLIGLADGEIMSDAQMQQAALRTLCNIVCQPVERFGSGVGRFHSSTSSRKKPGPEDDMLTSMWNCVRVNDGIMVLLKLLNVKTPIVEADYIRMLACRALAGMARSESIRQIIGKLPPLNNGQLRNLMTEPVLVDKRSTHQQFCKYASTLMQKIAGRHADTLGATTLEEIRRAGVVAQTKIIYQEKELLQLIHGHLLAKGLPESAAALLKEANLPKCTTPPPLHASSSSSIYSPSTPKIGRQLMCTPSSSREIAPPPSAHQSAHISASPAIGSFSTPTTPATPSHSIPVNGHLKFTLHKTPLSTSSYPKNAKRKFLKEKEGYVPASLKNKVKSAEYDVSLDKIITEFLRKQHALCPQPISTCPTMSLLVPHRCPEFLGKDSAAYSITSRLYDRQLFSPHGGLNGKKLNRRFMHSRLSPLTSFRDSLGNGMSSCVFDYGSNSLFLGTFGGDLKCVDVGTDGPEIANVEAHASPIVHVTSSKVATNLVFTSTWEASQNSALWLYDRETSAFKLRYRFDEHSAHMANSGPDRFVGTKESVARIYDTSTGNVVQKLFAESKANHYKFNVATFSATDELVLNDGNLWDVRSNKLVYKFDKLNQDTSGLFHPNGLEVIINSEIWDLRTFKLLRTVPALDQCQILFNQAGDVLYAVKIDSENMGDNGSIDYASTLRTFDAFDYSSIGTFDLKTTNIFDVAIDRNDQLVGVIEGSGQGDNTTDESVCRIYELGKTRDADDQVEEEEENPQDNGYDDDDDDDDDVAEFVEADTSDQESDGNADNGSDDAEDDDDDNLSAGFSSGNDDDDENDDDDNGDLDDVLFQLGAQFM